LRLGSYRIKWVAALAWALAGSSLGATADDAVERSRPAPLPVDYFTRDDTTGVAVISPDGKYVALSVGRLDDSGIVFLDTATRAVVGGVRARRGMEIDSVHWVSPTRVIYQIAERQPGERFSVPTGEFFGISVDGKDNVLLYGYRAGQSTVGTRIARRSESNATAVLLSPLEADERHVLIAEYPWRLRGRRWYQDPDAEPQITRLDVYSGRKTSLGFAPLANASLLVDRDDEVRFALGYTERGQLTVSWRPRAGADWEEFALPGFREESVVPRRFTADNRAVLFTAVPEGGSTTGLFRVDLESHAVERLFDHPGADITSVVSDFRRESIIGVRVHADRPELHFIDAEHPDARFYAMLQRAFPGHNVNVYSATRDGRMAVVWISSDVNPGEFYVFNTATREAALLQAGRPWVDPDLMRPKEPLRIAARDGLELPGFLTRPHGGEGPYPMVVLPHGGPHGVRDTWYFDWEVQLLANHGFAVLQVNFRGSAGYGMDFEAAGHGEWGARMQDDLTDATRWAIDSGLTEEGRVCIMGSSYGGYAALMGVAQQPSLYRCAVGLAGVYDLELLYTTGDIRHSRLGLDYLEKVIGRDRDLLRARSPVHLAERISVPVLLVHGSVDGRADYQHAQRMRRALEALGKPHELIALRGEGHGIYDEQTRTEVYRGVLAFLDHHIGGGAN
jgi:dipeptidyl aminopeptidase/acylaminoacyl peptidase